jgi:hypothetical protein
MIEQAREAGTQTRRKAADIVDNRFAEDLAKGGFLTELWARNCRNEQTAIYVLTSIRHLNDPRQAGCREEITEERTA